MLTLHVPQFHLCPSPFFTNPKHQHTSPALLCLLVQQPSQSRMLDLFPISLTTLNIPDYTNPKSRSSQYFSENPTVLIAPSLYEPDPYRTWYVLSSFRDPFLDLNVYCQVHAKRVHSRSHRQHLSHYPVIPLHTGSLSPSSNHITKQSHTSPSFFLKTLPHTATLSFPKSQKIA